LAACAASLALLAVAAVPVRADADGADVSYPECGTKAYPVAQGFGIVGVNGGRPGEPNPCLAAELKWALGTIGFDFEFGAPASLYINTADPGPGTREQPVASWPRSGGSPYGSCRGRWSTACAYVYGRRHGADAVRLVAQIDGSIASLAPWWLDVERANSWATRATPNFKQLNLAALRGFVDGLQTAGARGAIGIYSTPTDWAAITGKPELLARYRFGCGPPGVSA
jgi:hypothetical protein